jgi:integrase
LVVSSNREEIVMDTKDLDMLIPKFLEHLKTDGFSQDVIERYRRVYSRFRECCTKSDTAVVTDNVIASHILAEYGVDVKARSLRSHQQEPRKALLSLLDWHHTGAYRKKYGPCRCGSVPDRFTDFFDEYRQFVDSLGLAHITAGNKITRMRFFLTYLDIRGLSDIGDLKKAHVYDYLNNGKHSVHLLMKDRYGLREAIDWMYRQGTVRFSGNEALPAARAKTYSPVPSYYTDDEVSRVLEAIDTSTVSGKHDFLIVSLAAYYGLRCGDIAGLLFSNIDWQNGCISLVQQKTGVPLALPLIDEVRFPLIDYLKNARPESEDPHVLLTIYAPVTHYEKSSGLHWAFTKAIRRAGISCNGRHHGGHALRFSIAASLLRHETPLPVITGILGHTSSNTTKAYLGIDEKGLAQLALEVPDVSTNS